MLLWIVALAVSPSAAQGSGDWPQFQGDAAHTGVGSGPEPPYRVAWEFPVPRVEQRGASPAVIAGDLAITVGPDAVHAVELATGDEAWSVERELGPPVAPVVVAEGQRALLVYAEGGGIEGPSGTPTAGPTAQPGEGSDDRSRVVAIDLETRRLAWKVPYEMEGIVEAAPVAEGGAIVLGDSAGTLAALDASTGAERWTADAGGEVLRPPAIADERVVLSLREGEEVQPTVSAFDLADGERVWSVQPSVAAANPFTTVPSIGDGLVFLGSFDRVTRALSLEDGTQRWTNEEAFRQFAPITVPAVAGEELYLADDAGGLHRYDAATGEIVWSHALNAGVGFGAPVVVGDVVVLGLADGSLAAIDRESGELRSRVDAGDELGPAAVAPELLVVARSGPGSGLVGFEHDPDTALSAIESPSQVRPGTLLAMWAGGAAIVAIALLVPLRFVAGRTRPSPVQADAAEGPPPADEPPPDIGPVDDPAGGRS